MLEEARKRESHLSGRMTGNTKRVWELERVAREANDRMDSFAALLTGG